MKSYTTIVQTPESVTNFIKSIGTMVKENGVCIYHIPFLFKEKDENAFELINDPEELKLYFETVK